MRKSRKTEVREKDRQEDQDPMSRRKFIKKAGMGILVTSSYSLLSMVEFNCSSKSTDNDDDGGYGYQIYEWE